MTGRLQLVALTGLITLSSAAIAHDDNQDKPHYWKGSNASFGFNQSTGNTDTISLNAGLNALYTRGRWTEAAALTANYGKEKGVLSQQKYYVENQLNYAFSKTEKNFMFLNANSTFDHFSPYTYKINSSAGYGRQLIKNDKFGWQAQIGPGWAQTRERDTRILKNEFTLNPSTTATWHITSNNTLSETASASFSKPYSYYKSVTALTNNLLKHLATSINFQVEYYSNIPATSNNTKKLDTLTSVNLVYTF